MRLIDADAYREKLYGMIPEFGEEDVKKCIEGQTIFFCAEALNDMPTIAPPPNDPLTQEQLREMDGEPVWIRGNGLNRWYIFDGFSLDGIAFFTPEIGYGKMWAAYRRRPEVV